MKSQNSQEQEYVKCNLCGKNSTKELHVIGKFKHPFRIVKCKKCDLVYMNPRPPWNKIPAFYGKGYFTGKAGYNYQDERHNKTLHEKYSLKVNYWRNYKKRGRLLDIGCAFGEFLRIASTFYDCYGVEISKYAANYAQKRGLKVFHGILEKAHYPDKFFDIVNMASLIEHLPNPNRTLRIVSKILKDDGILIIETSNIDNFYAKIKGQDWDYFLPGHLYYFSIHTLNKILAINNLKLIDIGRTKFTSIKELLKNKRGKGVISHILLKLKKYLPPSILNLLVSGTEFYISKA